MALQEDSVDDIKEVRSILQSIKRDQEKHNKVGPPSLARRAPSPSLCATLCR